MIICKLRRSAGALVIRVVKLRLGQITREEKYNLGKTKDQSQNVELVGDQVDIINIIIPYNYKRKT